MTTKKTTNEKIDGCNGIKATYVQVFTEPKPTGKTKAFARVLLNDVFQLTGLRVIDGASGLFVSYPTDSNFTGEDYRSAMYPVTKDLREHIESVVLAEYQKQIKQ